MTNHLEALSDTSALITTMLTSRNGKLFARQTFWPADGQPRELCPRSGIFAERPPRVCRHWSPESQVYAPGDVLLHLISDGWRIYRKVFVESYRCVSQRYVNVYHFVLLRGNERLSLRVVANPAVRRVVQEQQLTVLDVVQ